jgi:hypothetical protein
MFCNIFKTQSTTIFAARQRNEANSEKSDSEDDSSNFFGLGRRQLTIMYCFVIQSTLQLRTLGSVQK